MPLASSGTWASLGRQVAAGVRNAPHARGLHVPRRAPQLSTTQRVFQSTKGLAQSLFGHLTTPGNIGRQPAARSLHQLTAGRTIQKGLSLPARHALSSRPLGMPGLPRAPAVPRGVHQVGLGTARNFTTGRPIFAHLVENVPVAGRAISEADWKIQRKKEMAKFAKANAKKEKTSKVKAEKVVLRTAASVNTEASLDTVAETQAELERYFPVAASASAVAAIPEVTATLLIPLAPTPSSRMPLPKAPISESQHPIVPFAEMSTLHFDFTHHNERVAALFSRLDAANVWDAGARCDVYGDVSGEANVLRVAFDGWDAMRVRSVIGETASGWCVLEEDRPIEEADMEDMDALTPYEGLSPPLSPRMEATPTFSDFGVDIDPAQSFVLPTLDFSSSFGASTLSSLSDDGMSEVDYDYFSDSGSVGSAASWVGLESPARPLFSSSFGSRTRMEDEGPMESMF
ncbi:hypothetical protein PENSPDRAFT_752284 [Peniophora sp. CONT]|nr:hypothetical protein PENSPDRAFT_752284 [Peniophora sp. CONT]